MSTRRQPLLLIVAFGFAILMALASAHAATRPVGLEHSVPSGGSYRYDVQPTSVGPNDVSRNGPEPPPLFKGPPLLKPPIDCFNFDDNIPHTGGFVFIPPDPHVAVGTEHVVNVGNVLIEWRRKDDPILENQQSLESFFGAYSGGPPDTTLGTFTFDPKAIYDQYNDRFVVVALERWAMASGDPSNESRILVAVSKTHDPNAGWWFHVINSKLNIGGVDAWADYPGLAIDGKAVYVAVNYFNFPGLAATYGMRLWIIDDGPTYAGPDGSIVAAVYDPYTAAGVGAFQATTQPAHMYGPLGAGSTGQQLGTFLTSYSGLTNGGPGGLEFVHVIEVTDPLGGVGGPFFVQQFVPCDDIEDVGGGFGFPPLTDAPQSGGAAEIEVNDRRTLNAVWRDNCLYTCATVTPNAGADAGQTTAHWWKIDTTVPMPGLVMGDHGNVGADGDLGVGTYTFFPSVMVDCNKNMAIGFSASNAGIFCGAYYACRKDTDPAGTIGPTRTLHIGTDYYERTFCDRNRWGDYSGLAICPVDEGTFWVYNEYACTRGTATTVTCPPPITEDGRWCTALGCFRIKSTDLSVVCTQIGGDATCCLFEWEATNNGSTTIQDFYMDLEAGTGAQICNSLGDIIPPLGYGAAFCYPWDFDPQSNRAVICFTGGSIAPGGSVTGQLRIDVNGPLPVAVAKAGQNAFLVPAYAVHCHATSIPDVALGVSCATGTYGPHWPDQVPYWTPGGDWIWTPEEEPVCEEVCEVRIHHNEKDREVKFCPAPPGTLHVAWWDFDTPPNCDPMGWTTHDLSGFGNYAALYSGTGVLQEDACLFDPTCLWGFFDNPAITNYGCATPVPQPAQGAIAYGGPLYLDNEIWSPPIPCIGTGSTWLLEFDVYRDLDFDALVFYGWKVRSFVGADTTEWRDKNWCYYGCGKSTDWIHHSQEIGDLIEPGATAIQVALGARDMCEVWCGFWGTGACHSQGPLFDNVHVLRVDRQGPAWDVRQINLFQDTFAEDGTTTGNCRADAALDINSMLNPAVLPGDSVSVCVSDKENGLNQDPFTGIGPAVYCYVALWPPFQPGKGPLNVEAPEIRAPVGKRYPYVNTVVHDGVEWWCFRMDTAHCDPLQTIPVPNKYCFDLNDAVFTPCDTVCFVFCAENTAGVRTYWSEFTGTTNDLWHALSGAMEFTCLPAGGWKRGGDILYVDAFDGRGAQPYFDTAFQMLGIEDQVDRYDQRGPSSLENNGLASRVVNPFEQLIPCYRKIIWNSGDLPLGTIGDGSLHPVKPDDFGLLYAFLDQHPNNPGIYLSGDNIAQEWDILGGPGPIVLRANYLGFVLVDCDHVFNGEEVSPCLVGVGPCFTPGGFPDSLIAYGGCPKINNFDVVLPAGAAVTEMWNPVTGSPFVISQTTPNSVGSTARAMLATFSFHWIASKGLGIPARTTHLQHVLQWLQNDLPEPTGIGTQLANYLDANYPNPFNPVTTIRYGIKEPMHVSLKVYNVAGQLVRTLVDEMKTPEPGGLVARWDGTSNAGGPVASGVYFYKLVTKEYKETRRMVLLK